MGPLAGAQKGRTVWQSSSGLGHVPSERTSFFERRYFAERVDADLRPRKARRIVHCGIMFFVTLLLDVNLTAFGSPAGRRL